MERRRQGAGRHTETVAEREGVEVRWTAPIHLPSNPATHVQFSTHASDFSEPELSLYFQQKWFSFNHEQNPPKLLNLDCKGEFHQSSTEIITLIINFLYTGLF